MGHRLVIEDLRVTLGDAERTFTVETGSWSVAGGEAVAVTGPSGTGKTLLLELLGLMRAPRSGNYKVENADAVTKDLAAVWSAPDAARDCADARARLFGFVPQAGGLLPFLTVLENIAVSQQIAGRVDLAWVEYLVDELGLLALGGLRPAALSIGQRQRVAIARALAHRPLCVIADEPTAALDPESAATAMRLLIEAARTGGAATLIASHDLRMLQQFGLLQKSLQIVSAPNEAQVVSRVQSLPHEGTVS
ncbi:MAG: ATP-binding cassette domain-containing protein [Pseudomonadota bacterium]